MREAICGIYYLSRVSRSLEEVKRYLECWLGASNYAAPEMYYDQSKIYKIYGESNVLKYSNISIKVFRSGDLGYRGVVLRLMPSKTLMVFIVNVDQYVYRNCIVS